MAPLMADAHALPVVLVCRLDEAVARGQDYRGLLDQQETTRLQGLRSDAARGRYLVTRALVRHGLAQHLDCRPEALEFTAGPQGKPEVVGGGCYFNVSHSHDRVVLALSGSAPVGVDVEFHGRRNRLDDLARHYFAAGEQAHLEALPVLERRRQFFVLWTLKEAYAKACGCSLWDILADTALELPGDAPPRLFVKAKVAPVSWWHLPLAADYSLGLVSFDLSLAGAALPVYELVPGGRPRPLTLTADICG